METKVKTKALRILSILFCIVLFSVMFFAFTGVTGNAYALNENDGTYFANNINFATNGKTSGFDSFHGACTGLVAWILAMVSLAYMIIHLILHFVSRKKGKLREQAKTFSFMRLIGVIFSGAVLIASVIITAIHPCIESVCGMCVATIVALVSVFYWLDYRKAEKNNTEYIKETVKTEETAETKIIENNKETKETVILTKQEVVENKTTETAATETTENKTEETAATETTENKTEETAATVNSTEETETAAEKKEETAETEEEMAYTFDERDLETAKYEIKEFNEEELFGEQATAEEEPPEEETAVPEEEEDIVEEVKEVAHEGTNLVSHVRVRYRKSFMARMKQSTPQMKMYYTELKNEILSYEGTSSRLSWNYDSINYGKIPLVKFGMRGELLCVYFALNPEDYAGTRYTVRKVEAKRYEKVPCMYKMRTDKRFAYAKYLFKDVADKYGIKRGEDHKGRYGLKTESTEKLVEKGLIKEIVKTETIKRKEKK